MIDQHFTLKAHVNRICSSAMAALRKIGGIRDYLDQHTAEMLVHAFVTSRLDSSNALLGNLPDLEIKKLQQVQNIAARIVLKARRHEHITPLLLSLHWLPIHLRIQYKILLIVYKALHGDRTAGEFGLAALPGRQKEFQETFELSVDYCKALCCKRMHVMPGKIPAHEESQRSTLLSQMEDTLVENLKYAADRLKREDITAVIEPINDRYTIPNYFLTRQDQAVNIIKRVDCDNVKLQLDIYHVQLVHGDLTRIIKEYMPYVGHIQVSQAPGRNEPSLKGEIDYDYIFDVLEGSDYDGWIGAEYKPSTGNTEDSLAWFQRFR